MKGRSRGGFGWRRSGSAAMSPRKPAALRAGDGQDLRDFAREARGSDGVLYSYFEYKEDLLAHALRAHVGTVMTSRPRMPPAGTGTVADNLGLFIDMGLDELVRVVPAF